MFHNDRMRSNTHNDRMQSNTHNDRMRSNTHKEKLMSNKTKKYKSHKNTNISKQAKCSKSSKIEKNRKHSKFKCINAVSDYLGPDRLTKHVGFLSKGKISNSISRIEKIMSKEVKARAQQDLQEVLKLSHSGKNKHKKIVNISYENITPETRSLQNIYKSPQYLNNKTGFASSSWKNKLQMSVGVATVNSVLASVHGPQKASPIKELQLLARKVLLNTIHPFVKEANGLLFPGKSHINKMRNKLCGIRRQFLPHSDVSFKKASPSVINSQMSLDNGKISSAQSSIEDNFHLNPIYTGDVIDQSDITQIFPSVNEFMNGNDDDDDVVIVHDSVNISGNLCNSEIKSSQAQSSIGGKSSITLVPTSPLTSEEDSPVWKMQLSPAKLKPEFECTPTLYFRHKMF